VRVKEAQSWRVERDGNGKGRVAIVAVVRSEGWW
jgi:hypothetical protein